MKPYQQGHHSYYYAVWLCDLSRSHGHTAQQLTPTSPGIPEAQHGCSLVGDSTQPQRRGVVQHSLTRTWIHIHRRPAAIPEPTTRVLRPTAIKRWPYIYTPSLRYWECWGVESYPLQRKRICLQHYTTYVVVHYPSSFYLYLLLYMYRQTRFGPLRLWWRG